MNNYSALYWLTRIDKINDIFFVLLIVSIAIYLFTLLYHLVESEFWDSERKVAFKISVRKWKPILIACVILSSTWLTFVPTKKDILLIYAGGKTLNFVESDSSMNKIPAQTTKIITDYLQKAIDEAKK